MEKPLETYVMESAIDREKVRERVNYFIENSGRVNIYIGAPKKEVLEKFLYAREVLDKEIYHIPIIQSSPSAFPTAMMAREMNFLRKDFNHAEYITILAKNLVNGMPFVDFKEARELEVKARKGLKGYWDRWLAKQYDKNYRRGIQRAYDWLQENQLLEQCDLKNLFAMFGIKQIDAFNRKVPETMRAPIDEFVVEQVRRVPEKLLEKPFGDREIMYKWLREDQTFDFECPMSEIYG